MEFALTDEQILLRDSVKRFVDEAHDLSREQESFRIGSVYPEDQWAVFSELGWLSLMVSEEAGGLGGKPEDAGIILEELGRGLIGAPYLSTAVLCAELIDAGEDSERRTTTLEGVMAGRTRLALASEEASSRYDLAAITTVARADGEDQFVLNGQKIVVTDGTHASAFIVTARTESAQIGIGPSFAMYLVPSDTCGISIRRYHTIDGRQAADIDLNDVRVPRDAMIISPDRAPVTLEAGLDRTRVIMAFEALGAMDNALSITADYVKTRQQFGRSLASFQSLQHRLADMFVKLENARSMVYRALAMLDGDPAARAAAVSATMITINQAAEFIGANAIQLHGGIGMAEEHVIGHYYKRLRVIGKTYGDLNWHMNRYIRLTTIGDRQEAA